ncbi:MAG: hypothetical protein JXA13_05185 [Anaerolineales bacterium]|nr:hypothetical protein [Anaerolineales bacterium]
MLTSYHRSITTTALEDVLSPQVLKVVISANLSLDNLPGQIGHDEYHFDNNAFEAGKAFIEAQRSLVAPALRAGNKKSAWTAFGKLTHTAQDFYAHSNYVRLWLADYEARVRPSPDQIEPLIPELLSSPDLRSGKLYYPWEALSFLPGIRKLVIPLLPLDSHAWMNLDSPRQGQDFFYAVEAATKRTRYEYDWTIRQLTSELAPLFTGIRREYKEALRV